MTNIVELEISRALAAAGCGIVRRRVQDVVAERKPEGDRDWLHVATKGGSRGPALITILRAVSCATGITTAELKSPRRRKDIVRARMIYFALARRLTSQSFPAIGRIVGGKDHSTVMHGIWKVEHEPATFEPEMTDLTKAFRSDENGDVAE
ncbi:MAG TPA: helix-turn-helix domain-containing protein [Bryobacteraceae bacterium]|nr:helix-turn-helix domain-containing protein [Bryobacteraceae bacterium]